MATLQQHESVVTSRLEEISTWTVQATMRFSSRGYQSCITALNNIIKVAKEAKTMVSNIKKVKDGNKKTFLKTIKKASRKKGLNGRPKTKKAKSNGKSKRTRKSTSPRNKKKA